MAESIDLVQTVSGKRASARRLKLLYFNAVDVSDVHIHGNDRSPAALDPRSRLAVTLIYGRLPNYKMNGSHTSSSSWQQLKTKYKRSLWKSSRRLAVLLANTYLRPLVNAWAKPEFLFAVYGNEQQVGAYFTPWMAKRLPPNVVLGFIRNGAMRGLLIAPQFFEHELQNDTGKVRSYINQLQKDYPGIKRIALVGRLPNFVKKAGMEIREPLVDGSLGTRYMIWDIARQMAERPQYSQQKSIVVLGGAGRIGNAVCQDLASQFGRVIGLDPRYQEDEEIKTPQGSILRTSNLDYLNDEKLFIALTHHGDAVLDFHQHIPAGSLIADDTHPCISYQARAILKRHQISVEKVVLSHDDFMMRPRMPDWNSKDIPGCLVEALVLLQDGELADSEFAEFCREAESLGFSGRLIKPLDE